MFGAHLVGAHMKITRVIALAVIAASGGVASVHAQNLRNADQPAEFPPASYKSTQYVDSRGCVYVRAGISGNVTWVPRVRRARKQICNQTHSLAGQTRTAAAAPAAKAPVQITIDPKPAAKPAVKAKPKPVAAVKPKPKPKPKPAAKPKVRKPARVATVAAPKPAPAVKRKPVVRRIPARKVATQIAVAKPAPQIKTAPAAAPVRKPVVRRQTACAGASAVSQRYMAGQNVRCGPQAQAYASARVAGGTYASNGSAPTGQISGATRVVPKHVLVQRQNTQNTDVPAGYKRVWEDDRLNPKRAEQTLAGQARTKLIWTSTVPRRLINQTNGRDVTASVPLVYPYLDVATQTRELGVVSIVRRDGQVLKRIQRNTAAKSYPVRKPTISSRSALKPAAPAAVRAAPKAAPATSQLVQVATYSDKAAAQSVAKRLQRMGLPVRIGKYQRGGKTYRMVLAGPFGRDATQQLNAVRRAGYPGAFLRR